MNATCQIICVIIERWAKETIICKDMELPRDFRGISGSSVASPPPPPMVDSQKYSVVLNARQPPVESHNIVANSRTYSSKARKVNRASGKTVASQPN
jgi:hypothetical protein